MFMFMRWCFYSHLVLQCTNVHQNKPIFSCFCLSGGAFTCILYFNVQTGTKTNLFLVVYVYMRWCFYLHLVLRCTNRHRNKPIFSCLCLWGGAFSRILYFGVQAGTKNKPIFSCLCLWGGALEYISNARLQFLNPILPQRKIVSAV